MSAATRLGGLVSGLVVLATWQGAGAGAGAGLLDNLPLSRELLDSLGQSGLKIAEDLGLTNPDNIGKLTEAGVKIIKDLGLTDPENVKKLIGAGEERVTEFRDYLNNFQDNGEGGAEVNVKRMMCIARTDQRVAFKDALQSFVRKRIDNIADNIPTDWDSLTSSAGDIKQQFDQLTSAGNETIREFRDYYSKLKSYNSTDIKVDRY